MSVMSVDPFFSSTDSTNKASGRIPKSEAMLRGESAEHRDDPVTPALQEGLERTKRLISRAGEATAPILDATQQNIAKAGDAAAPLLKATKEGIGKGLDHMGKGLKSAEDATAPIWDAGVKSMSKQLKQAGDAAAPVWRSIGEKFEASGAGAAWHQVAASTLEKLPKKEEVDALMHQSMGTTRRFLDGIGSAVGRATQSLLDAVGIGPSQWREGNGEEKGDTLPEGWMEDVATDGRPYYFRKDDPPGTTTWERPPRRAESQPPRPAGGDES